MKPSVTINVTVSSQRKQLKQIEKKNAFIVITTRTKHTDSVRRHGGKHPLQFGMTSVFHMLDHLSLTSPPSATRRGTEQEYWQV